jgi:hypothetical protein
VKRINVATVAPALAALAATAALAAIVAPALAATAQQTLHELNVQRSTNGLPAGITLNQTWSNDCLAHDQYMEMNGDVLTHAEVPGAPGYSAGGAYAGANSVLAQGSGWDTGNPYQYAPLHLDQLLAPRLATVGTGDADGFSCTTTFPGWTRPAPSALTVWTYPGPRATIYSSEIAAELPFTPGQLVGMRSGAVTGPYLFVFVDAPDQSATDNPATLSQVTLTGPAGTVSTLTADGRTAVPRTAAQGCQGDTLSCYIAPGGFIIPVRPLRPHATYRAHFIVTFAGTQTSHTWTFKTVGAPPQSALTLTGMVLRFVSNSPAPIRITFKRATGARAPTRVVRPGHSVHLNLSPGSWLACGHQAAKGRFGAFAQCISILVTGIPKIHFGNPRVVGQTVQFPITVSPVLKGRTATLTTTPLTVNCASGICTTVTGTPTTQTQVLNTGTITLPLPAPGQGVQLMLETPAFQLRDAPWVAAQATSKQFTRSPNASRLTRPR